MKFRIGTNEFKAKVAFTTSLNNTAYRVVVRWKRGNPQDAWSDFELIGEESNGVDSLGNVRWMQSSKALDLFLESQLGEAENKAAIAKGLAKKFLNLDEPSSVEEV